MKTIKEYLNSVDEEELINQYMADFPPDVLEWMSHKEMVIGDYYESRKHAIHKHIHRLKSLDPTKQTVGSRNIFFAYRNLSDFNDDIEFSLVDENELKEKGCEAEIYSCIMIDHREVVGFCVADNKLTQHYLYNLLAFVLHEATYFGFEQEYREEAIRTLKKSEDQIKNHPETLHSMEEIDEMMKEKYGIDRNADKEASEEEELHQAAIKSWIEYRKYSKKRELNLLIQNLSWCD